MGNILTNSIAYTLKAEDHKQPVQTYVMTKSYKTRHTEHMLQCQRHLRLSYIHNIAGNKITLISYKSVKG